MSSLQRVSVVGAAWVLSIAFDLLLHGGILAGLYVEPGPFLLPPNEAFRRIPIGYLAFLIATVAVFWLLRRLDVRGAPAGARIAGTVGGIAWAVFALGLYSITTAPAAVLACWWIGQTIELALAGAVIGSALGGTSLRRIWMRVAAIAIACVVLTIVLQSIGWAPAVRME